MIINLIKMIERGHIVGIAGMIKKEEDDFVN